MIVILAPVCAELATLRSLTSIVVLWTCNINGTRFADELMTKDFRFSVTDGFELISIVIVTMSFAETVGIDFVTVLLLA